MPHQQMIQQAQILLMATAAMMSVQPMNPQTLKLLEMVTTTQTQPRTWIITPLGQIQKAQVLLRKAIQTTWTRRMTALNLLGFVCPGLYTHTQTVENQSPLGVISAGDASHAQTGGTPAGSQVAHVRTGELP